MVCILHPYQTLRNTTQIVQLGTEKGFDKGLHDAWGFAGYTM